MTTDKLNKLGEGEFAVAAEYLIALQEFTAERGMPPQAFLAGSGLPLSALIQPQARIGHHAFEQVIFNVLDFFPDPLFAIEYGKRLSISKHGMLGFAAQSSSNLMEAAGLLVQYINTRTGGGEEFELVLKEEYASLRLRPGDAAVDETLARFHAITTFINLESLGRWLTGKQEDVVHTEINLTFNSTGEIPSSALSPGLALNFNAMVNEMRLPLSLLTEPLPHANPELASVAQAECEAEMIRLGVKTDVAAMVRSQIRDANGRLPTLDTVADGLHMSARTLKRKLHDVGTTYQKIKDSERFRKAIHLLEVTDSSMEKVAEELGYSNASNFNKAFKGWAEQSPSEYRQRLRNSI